jgi:hypothetical protein
MAVHGNVDWSARLDVLEHKVARQRKVALLGVLVGLVLGVVLSARIPPLFAQTTKPLDTLTVRELIVVDAKGVERVRIGAPLPGPIVNGRRVPRQGVVSGVLIYDAEGDERGGYVTEEHGDAMLTLDAKGRQQTIFIANRDGGANLAVWSGNNRNDNYVSVQAVPNPLIEIKQNGKTRVFSVAEPRN